LLNDVPQRRVEIRHGCLAMRSLCPCLLPLPG
jgi:hypothetical protein